MAFMEIKLCAPEKGVIGSRQEALSRYSFDIQRNGRFLCNLLNYRVFEVMFKLAVFHILEM